MEFIQSNKEDVVEGRKLGIELICRALRVASSTCYPARDSAPSARTPVTLWCPGICIPSGANEKVHWVQKFRNAARRLRIDIARDQTARLMRSLGIEGVERSKRVKATNPDLSAFRHSDLVMHYFIATAPNQLWVPGLKCAPT